MSVVPWSFSRIKAFEQCPKQFYHIKIAKDYVEEETHAMRVSACIGSRIVSNLSLGREEISPLYKAWNLLMLYSPIRALGRLLVIYRVGKLC